MTPLFMLVSVGGSLDKQQHSAPYSSESFFGGQPALRAEEALSQPQWYVDRCYPTTDTDGDGIPDVWGDPAQYVAFEDLDQFCPQHGPGPVVTATLTGFEPPLRWEILNTPVSEDGGLPFSPQSASWDSGVCAVRCSKLDGHTNVVLSATIAFSGSHCEPAVTNIVGAGWTSTHNPTNATDHEPGVEVSYSHFTEDCPVTTNVLGRARPPSGPCRGGGGGAAPKRGKTRPRRGSFISIDCG